MSTMRNLAAVGLIAALATLSAGEALAHGEKAQEAFLRMRGVHWFETEIGPITVSVNDEITVTGKFMPSVAWPDHIPKPDVAFLNIGVPGPSFVRLRSEVNGVNMVNSTSFALGGVYEYKVVLKARRPGRYHVHPLINVYNAGPLVGPGIWVDVEGRFQDYSNTVTTIAGDEVELESYNLGTIYSWHMFWLAAGVAWLVYWIFFRGRQLMPRYRQVRKLGDDADDMITPRDRKLAVGVYVATLLVVAYGFFSTEAKHPNTIPLQTGRVKVEPLPAPDQWVEAELKRASYEIPGRDLTINVVITNNTERTLQLGEFASANVRFINSDILDLKPADSHDLIAPSGLRITGGAIPAGESRELTLHASDAMWETQRLSRLIYDPDSRFAGVMFFFDEDGNKHAVEIYGPMLPTFEAS
jgi:methane/ammonia monooxygenase subunit B